MKNLLVLLFVPVFFLSQNNKCLLTINLYRADKRPLDYKLVTFRSDDEQHHVEVITGKNGYCKVALNKNTHYNIIYEDIFYSKLFKIPYSSRIDYSGKVIIDGGLFAIVKLKVLDNSGNNLPLKSETIICESEETGELLENKTNQLGVVEFYLPRNSNYKFHSVFEKSIKSISIDDGNGVSIYRISLRTYTTPESQYYLRIKRAEQEAIAREKQRKLEDSLVGTIPITVVLFINTETNKDDFKLPYLNEVNVYTSKSKNKKLGIINGNWSVNGLCEKGYGLCSRVIKNKDGSFVNAVLPVKLKRGIHQLYLENNNGDFKKQVEVNVSVHKSFEFLKNNSESYYITSPMCVLY
tara:strand:+ start:2114 stop:3169 length:1056 start_codon:yes stop_codon:yes gene_type:complete